MYAPRGGVDRKGSGALSGRRVEFRAHELRKILKDVEPDYQWRESHRARPAPDTRRLDARLPTIEINRLRSQPAALIAADAKVVRDEWAHFRNQEIHALREADKGRRRMLRDCLDMGHMYVRLDGDIGSFRRCRYDDGRDGHDRGAGRSSGLFPRRESGADVGARLSSCLAML